MTTTKGELLPLIRISFPLVVVHLGFQFMSVVDTAFAGRIDALSQGATGIGNMIFFLGMIFGIGVIMGVDPIASQAFGAEKPRHARRAMWHGVYAAFIIAIPITLVIFGLGQSLELFGIKPELAEKSRLYLHSRLAGLLPILLTAAVRVYLQAAHRMWPIVLSLFMGNAFNFIADGVLVFGDDGLQKFGLPAMGIPAYGVEGIGWATTAGAVVFLIFLMIFTTYEPPGPGGESLRKIDSMILRHLFRLGLPIGLQMTAEMGIFALVGIIAGTIGTIPVAAHQVAIMVASFMFMVPLGIGLATSIQVGRAIGRGDSQGTRSAGLCGIGLASGYMFFSALIMWLFPETLARIMTADPEVIPLAADLLIIAAVFQIVDGIQAVGSGALRGAGMTSWAMWANLFAYWVIAMPVSLLLGFTYGMGPHGLWWGLTVGLAVAAVVLTLKFHQISRKPIKPLS